MDHSKLENFSRDRNTRPPYLPPENSVCWSKQQLEPDMEQWTSSKLGKTSKLYIVTLLINAEYIKQNAGLEESQAGIQITGRNIKNLRYADDTTLMAESEE